MSTVVIRPRGPVSILRSDGRLRVNIGGPGLRGLPGATGAAGGFTGSESAVGRLLDTDSLPVKVGSTAYMAPVSALRNVIGFYPRAGTMSDKTGDNLLFMSTSAPAFVDPSAGAAATKYNGAAIAGVAAFNFNNSTYGGSSGVAVHASIQALIDAAKAVDELANPAYAYGQPFWLAKLTAGAGTTVPGSGAGAGTYLAAYLVLNQLVNAPATARIMARVVAGSAFFVKNDRSTLFKNGVIDASAYVPIDSTFRHFVEHIAAGGNLGRGYSLPLRLYCSPGAEVEFALPDFCSGHVNLPFHIRPLMAGNRT